MNPLDILYSWPALLCVSACIGITQAAKRALDVRLGEARKESRLLSVFVLPTLPVAVGALYAVAVPLHPDALVAYLAERGLDGWEETLSLAAWGAACGQFSTFLYERIERLARAS